MRSSPSRRRFLATTSSLAIALTAGCSDSTDDADSDGADDDGSPTDGAESDPSEGTTAGTDESATPEGESQSTATPEEGSDDGGEDSGADPGETETADLDLREANVIDVEFEARDGAFRFDVALHHDDDGEDGYANWWQVERLDGTQLGRRDLLHAHSEQPFTRSETVDIPDGVSCVVVRGHDQTHEYGGVAMLVDLGSGETRAVDQGPERADFDEGDCP